MIAGTEVITHLRQDEAERILRPMVARLQQERNEPGLLSITWFLRRLAQHHRHCVKNVILIDHQRPGATHVAKASEWKQFERSICAGEKPIWLLHTINEHEDPIAVEEVIEVFDVEQTEGPDLPRRQQHPDRELRFIGFDLLYSSVTYEASGVELISGPPSCPPEAVFARRVEAYFEGVMHESSIRTLLGEGQIKAEVDLATYVVCQAMNVNPGIRPPSAERVFGQSAIEVLDGLERIQYAASRILSHMES